MIETKTITRRAARPDTVQASPDAADMQNARLVRWGISPSYRINLGSLTGNRYTGHDEILPRVLYEFRRVTPVGINEDGEERMNEEIDPKSIRAYKATDRQPRTCARDVADTAGDRVFVVPKALVGREDAPELWAVVYPVEVEAEIWMMTDPKLRGGLKPAEDGPVAYLQEYFDLKKINEPYEREGHALTAFIRHLSKEAPKLILAAGLDDDAFTAAESLRVDVLQAAEEALARRVAALGVSFGSIEQRRNSGMGKSKLSPHDEECLAETGMEKPQDAPALASQKMGAEVGKQIAQGAAASSDKLAAAVESLAQGQQVLMTALQQQGAALAALLQDRQPKQEG